MISDAVFGRNRQRVALLIVLLRETTQQENIAKSNRLSVALSVGNPHVPALGT